MSENETKENKNNNNKGGNHHRRHHRHNNKNKNNRPNEQKAAETVKNGAPQNQKNNNQKNNAQRNNDQRQNSHKGSRNDSQKKRAPEQSILDTTPDNDSIFGKLSFTQPVKKEKPAPKEPIEIRELSDEELFGTSHILYTPKTPEDATVEIVGIRFKSHGKVYYFDPNVYERQFRYSRDSKRR